jgi:hypothetical protein
MKLWLLVFINVLATYTSFDEKFPVCLDELADTEVVETTCKHKFHPACIGKWTSMKPSCPVCRHKLPTRTATRENTLSETRVFIHGMTGMTLWQYYRLAGVVRHRARDHFRPIEEFLNPIARARLETDIKNSTNRRINIQLSDYMTHDEFIAFRDYMATREYFSIPSRYSVNEYLEYRRQDVHILGFEVTCVTHVVSDWIFALRRFTVKQYSRRNIPEPLSLLDLMSFRIIGIFNYRSPGEIAAFLDRLDNIILRRQSGLFDDLNESDVGESNSLMDCAAYILGEEVVHHTNGLRQMSLGEFIRNSDCVWNRMRRPYRVFSPVSPASNTTERPVNILRSAIDCLKKTFSCLSREVPAEGSL